MPSHMCDLLLSKEHEVICVDNLVTGNMDNIAHCMEDKDNFTFIDHDISKPLFLDEDIDYIFHMASPASPVDYLELPIQTLKVGALGTYNMLGLAKAKGHASSSPPHQRSTVILWLIHNLKNTGAT
jgi:dTDP-glucose 4,6-dehydratase